jgi:hypothetical protein
MGGIKGLKKLKRAQKLNRTPEGELGCAFGTPWIDHLQPPSGTGRGCAACENSGGKANANGAENANGANANGEENVKTQNAIGGENANANECVDLQLTFSPSRRKG